MNKFERVTKSQFLADLAPSENDEDWVGHCWSGIILPKRLTAHSAGYDFYLPYDVSIPPRGTKKIYTGVKCRLDNDCVLLLDIRSSIGINRGLSLANTIGVIDADYYDNSDNEGHIILCVYNRDDEWKYLDSGNRIAQGIIVKYETVEDDSSTGKRKGGIGSTNE